MGVLQYDNLEAKRSKFKYSEQARITSESDFNDFFYTHNGRVREFVKSSIFRGVGEAKWKIFSSCQRAFLSGKVFGVNQSSFIEREIKHLEDSVLPDYYKKLGIPQTVFLYLSFLQHYGAPTTLIDFSTNYKTALWIAANCIQYPCPTDNSDDVNYYFSFYWIEKNERMSIPSILNAYKSYYLNSFMNGNDRLATENLIDSELINVLRDSALDKKSILENILDTLKWDNGRDNTCLARTRLGIINSNNNLGRYDRRHSLKQIVNEMQSIANNLSRHTSISALRAFKNIIFYLYNDVIKIANLNLVAQDGCFIHYLPEDYHTPLEENPDLMGKIHCVDIHKSLAPFILKKLENRKVTQSTLFPDTYALAQNAFSNAQAAE